jgi:hypothetical protein
MTMSDLGQLFQLCGWGPKPLENFTTTALAIAINHDDRPMKQALKAIDWSHQAKPGCTVIPRTDTAADDIVSVAAATQVTLWATRCDESPGGRRFEEDP